MTMLRPGKLMFEVAGKPAPQGSKKGIPIKKKGGGVRVAVVESNADKLKTWREDVRAAASEAMRRDGWATLEAGEGVSVTITFWMARPKSHYGTGRNAEVLKPSAPVYPVGKPDADKLLRGMLDAMTSAGVYRDDSQVVKIAVEKHFVRRGIPEGATVTVFPR